jgi:hypothetical protein
LTSRRSPGERFCGANTGNEGDDRNWGEFCFTDGMLDEALSAAIPGAAPRGRQS